MDVLDPNTRVRVDQLASRVWVNRASGSSRVIRSACEQALTEQRVLRIDYVAANGAASRRDVEPMVFANTNGNWYLVGWCRLRDAVRWFLVSRIRRASVTREPCAGHSVAEIGTPPPTATSVGIGGS
ncbi:WYL domain-containing protein [Buchananella felis]|uniref:helix-turn-helix transcriptional regulator n=1 Tax=Buchananella felis TaxID=3231492 RepID=UPI0035284C56